MKKLLALLLCLCLCLSLFPAAFAEDDGIVEADAPAGAEIEEIPEVPTDEAAPPEAPADETEPPLEPEAPAEAEPSAEVEVIADAPLPDEPPEDEPELPDESPEDDAFFEDDGIVSLEPAEPRPAVEPADAEDNSVSDHDVFAAEGDGTGDAEETVLITFLANGGNGTMKAQTVPKGVSTKLNANTFTAPTGMRFDGWNLKADGSGTAFKNEARVKVSRNVTLYAQWVPNLCTLRFDPNGGSGTMKPQTVTAGVSTKLNANTFTAPAGMAFSSWNLKADGSGTAFKDGARVKVNRDATLYAQWVPTYTVRFVNEDGTLLQTETVARGTVPAYRGETPVKAADEKYIYVFAGWTPELAEATADATYTAVFTAKPIPACSFSLNLAEMIGINFYIGGLDDYTGMTVSWTKKDGTEVTMSVTNGVHTAGGSYFFALDTFASKEMTVPIPVTVKDADGNVLKEASCSIRSYCAKVMGLEGYEALKALCRATLDYGSFAQIFFKYRTDDLANPDADASVLPTVPETFKAARTGTCTNLPGLSMSLAMEYQTQINVYLFPSDETHTASEFEATVRSASGTVSKPVIQTATGGIMYITIPGIPAVGLGDTYTVTLRNRDDDSMTTLTVSALSYPYAVQTGEVNRANLGKALYNYYLKARDFA